VLYNIRQSNNKKKCLSRDQIESEEKTKVLISEKKGIETEVNIKSTNNETVTAFPNIAIVEKKPSMIEKKPIFQQTEFLLKKDLEKLVDEESNLKFYKEQPERLKTFKVKFIKNWYTKNGFTEPNIKVVKDDDFQSGVITDEIKVILDGINHFKITQLNLKDSARLFKNFSYKKQVQFNQIIEETCGLILESCSMILVDFYDFMPKFVAIQPPNPTLLKDRKTNNEYNTFLTNCEIFFKCNVFLKGCLDVYDILTKQVDDMSLSKQNFIVVQQYLARTRLNLSNLCFIMKNERNNIKFDEKVKNT